MLVTFLSFAVCNIVDICAFFGGPYPFDRWSTRFDLGIEMAISESSFIGGWDFNATSEKKKEKCMQLA